MKLAHACGIRSLTVAALIDVATSIRAATATSIRAATVRERWLRIAHHLRGRA